MKIDAIMIHNQDNVATALRDLRAGDSATVGQGQLRKSIPIAEDIPFGHKFAAAAIDTGENIIKYGEIIGRATCAIAQGTHAHVQNIESLRGRGDLD